MSGVMVSYFTLLMMMCNSITAGNMSIQGVMEWVRFDWVGDRSVKLKLRDSIMTFST